MLFLEGRFVCGMLRFQKVIFIFFDFRIMLGTSGLSYLGNLFLFCLRYVGFMVSFLKILFTYVIVTIPPWGSPLILIGF